MSRHRVQASTPEGGLRGMIPWAWHRGTRCATANAVRGRMLPARDQLSPAEVSGLVVQVLVTIFLGVGMGWGAGVMNSKRWLISIR